MSTTIQTAPLSSSSAFQRKNAPPNLKAAGAKAAVAQSQNLPAPPLSPSKARAQKKLKHHGSSSISAITGRTAIKLAEEAAARRSRRSQSPHGFRSGLEGAIPAPKPQPAPITAATQPSSAPGEQTFTNFRLPITLPRPTVPQQINAQFVKTMDPNWDMEKLPLEVLINFLRSPRTMGGLTAGLNAVEFPKPTYNGVTPSTLSMPIKPDFKLEGVSLPTHILLVTDKNSKGAIAFPVHALMMATQCARIPSFGPPGPRKPDANGQLVLPVVPLQLAHATSFLILWNYMYSRNASFFLEHTLRLGPNTGLKFDMSKSFEEMAKDVVGVIVQRFSASAIIDKLRWIWGMWCNVIDLAMQDPSIWHWMDTAWRLLIKALLVVRKQSGEPIQGFE